MKAACVQDGLKSGRGAITGKRKQPPVASSCNRPDRAETNARPNPRSRGGASPIDRLPTFFLSAHRTCPAKNANRGHRGFRWAPRLVRCPDVRSMTPDSFGPNSVTKVAMTPGVVRCVVVRLSGVRSNSYSARPGGLLPQLFFLSGLPADDARNFFRCCLSGSARP